MIFISSLVIPVAINPESHSLQIAFCYFGLRTIILEVHNTHTQMESMLHCREGATAFSAIYSNKANNKTAEFQQCAQRHRGHLEMLFM